MKEPQEPGPAESQKSLPSQSISLHPWVIPLSLLGLALSLLLEWVHVKTYVSPAADSFCTLGDKLDCAAVAASSSSVFLSIPWALWGALGFVGLLIAAFQRSVWLLPLAALSALTSLALLAISVLQVGSLCYICEAVHLITWVILPLVWRGRASLIGDCSSLSELMGILSPPAGIALALFLFLPHYWGAISYKSKPPYPTGLTEEGYPWIGAKQPEKVIHEFVDYRCPHCKISSTRTLKRLETEPTWRLVRRQQPRVKCESDLPEICLSMRLAHCALEQDSFWRADRWLFAHSERRDGPDPAKMARDLKLDANTLTSCINKRSTRDKAAAEARTSRKAGARFVPRYMVDGKMLKAKEVKALFD